MKHNVVTHSWLETCKLAVCIQIKVQGYDSNSVRIGYTILQVLRRLLFVATIFSWCMPTIYHAVTVRVACCVCRKSARTKEQEETNFALLTTTCCGPVSLVAWHWQVPGSLANKFWIRQLLLKQIGMDDSSSNRIWKLHRALVSTSHWQADDRTLHVHTVSWCGHISRTDVE